MTTAISPQLALYPGHSRAAWLALQGSWAFNKTTFNNRRQAFQPTMACGFHGACGSGRRSMGSHGLLAAARARRRWRALDGSVGKNYPTRRPSTLDIQVLWACWRLVGGVLCAMPAPIGWQGCTAFNGHADLRGGVFVRRVRLRQALGPWVLHSPWSACPSEDAG